MKKILALCLLLSGFIPISTLANTIQTLQSRLAKLNSFHAIFSQSMTNSNGSLIQNGAGELWVRRPNLFYWHMTSPDEIILISDGQTIWFYNPLIEQVTAMWLKNATNKALFMLLTNNNAHNWNQYQITQKDDNFELTPTSNRVNLQRFIVNVANNGNIYSIAIIEPDGKRITYTLANQQDVSDDFSKFMFTPPKDVALDDQRQ